MSTLEEHNSIRVFSGKNFNVLLRPMLQQLMQNGEEVSPRGKRTKEFYPALTVIQRPLERVNTIYGRGGNPFFLLAEVVWILSGRGDTAFLERYNKSILQFADEGMPDFNGAYGVRLRRWGQTQSRSVIVNGGTTDQMVDAYNKLTNDPETRQAVMTLHIPPLDSSFSSSKDRPCNVLSLFKVRKGKLHLHQFLRSNDLIWGLSNANIMQWSCVLEVMAAWLGLEVGEIMFFSDSLHVYLEDYSSVTAQKVLEDNREYDVYNNFFPKRMPNISREEFDNQLGMFFEEIDKNIRGIGYTSKVTSPFLTDILWMLKSFNAHKDGASIMDCARMLMNVKRKDYRVAALEYFARVSIEPLNIGNCVSWFSLDGKDTDYILHNAKVR